MANWSMSINSPVDGEVYSVTVEKPRGFQKRTRTGTGRVNDPFVLNYSSAPGTINSVDSWPLSQMVDLGPSRSAFIEIRIDNQPAQPGHKITPTVQDGTGGIPGDQLVKDIRQTDGDAAAELVAETANGASEHGG
jgi:hypothetical protein